MNKSLLFAIDIQTQEVIVSGSSKGSNKINFIERIKQSDNDMLYNAVQTLTSILNRPVLIWLYLSLWIKYAR